MRRKRTLILSVAAAVAAAGTAWIALPASAAAPTATLRTVADWGTGWQADVTVSNTGASAMTSWTVEFDLPEDSTVGSFWEADMKATGSHRTFSSRPWNGGVKVGDKVSFGFIGSGPLPTNCRLNGLPCGGSGGAPATSAATSAPATPVTTKATVPPTAPATTPPTEPPATAPTSGETAPPPPAADRLPLKVSNRTGRGDDTFLYVLGTDLKSGKLGYVDAGGTFTAWPGAGAEPVPAPDVSIPGPKDGASTTIKVPKGLSGRVYFSFAKKLDFRLTSGGLVQPAPWAGGDPNRNILFDWSEFTLDNGGLFLNSSQVDMFAVPHIVSVQGGNGVVTKTGELKADGRDKVIDAVKADSDFAKSVVKGSDGTVLRVLAPGKAADAGLMDPTYLNESIDEAWKAYASRTLTVAPFSDRPDTKFFGRTSGDVLNFTDGSGKTVASFPKPSTANVWGCDGALGAPNDQVVGPIARTLCAALTRGTLGTLDNQPSGGAADFYRGEDPNTYAKVIHQNMVDGKAYAFAFDDVQNQESLVHDGDPRTATITLTPF